MTEPSIRGVFQAYDDVLDNVIRVHSNVQMDTPEDKELHARAVEQFRMAQARVREARERALRGLAEPLALAAEVMRLVDAGKRTAERRRQLEEGSL